MVTGAVLSDIHFGHRKTPSVDIISNLNKDFKDDKEFSKLDIVFICGDVYDDLLALNHHELTDIEQWIVDFLRLCAKHNVVVRVLEGTPLHDWKQSNKFETLNSLARIGCNVRHIKTLYVETIESLNITVLYVPDEWNDSANKTLEQARSLIKEACKTSVDIAVMHGNFSHHLPPQVKAQRHSDEDYRKLVTGPIFIGHNHGYGNHNRIITPGSYDRLAHGEEHKKGHVRFNYDPVTGNTKTKFVQNNGAKIYKTITCHTASLEDVLAEIDRGIAGLPDRSYVRIMANVDNPILQNMETLSRLFSQHKWSKKVIGVEDKDDRSVDYVADSIVTPITITKENIEDLLIDRMRGGVDENDIPKIKDLIRDIVK